MPRPVPFEETVNQVREYLQIIILKSIFHSKYGSSLSFMGGTCLRICYNTKRYSEDLDFTLDKKNKGYSFSQLIENTAKELEMRGFKIDVNINEKTVVQKSFLKFTGVFTALDAGMATDQKLHIKLEVDTRPVKISNDQRESFFINKFNEMFPILKHKLDTLFAGKLLAILCRPYAKGRDYYDLIWYLSQRVPIDMKYLIGGIAQHNRASDEQVHIPKFKTVDEILSYLDKKISKVDTSSIMNDVGRFLEDPQEEKWIKNYRDVFKQCISSYASKK